MSGNVGSAISKSRMLENVGVAVGKVTISFQDQNGTGQVEAPQAPRKRGAAGPEPPTRGSGGAS